MIRHLLIASLVVAFVYCQIGGTQGPCSAVSIPGPFTEPVSLFGSTVGASATAVDCNDDDLDGGAAWYSIAPTAGVTVNITTCAPYTNFDTIIVVYTGGCQALQCLLIEDDSDGCSNPDATTATFTSTGQEYLIVVTGHGGTNGQFELTFSESAATQNSSCQAAITIPGPYTTPVTIYGNTEGSQGFSQSACGLSTSSHVDWYILNPAPHAQVEITTCNSVTNFDTQLAILEGNCNSLQCLIHNDDNCTTASGLSSYISFIPGGAGPYYLAVFGFSTNYGIYEVRVSQYQGSPSSPGVDCPSAVVVPFASGSTVNFAGTTNNNPVVSNSICGQERGPAAWYRIDVPSSYTGSIRASTCNAATNFDTILSVYSGSCDSLSCIAINDDNCATASGLLSTVQWSAQTFSETVAFATATRTPMPTPLPTRSPANANDRTFFISVTGFSGAVGSYDLNVQFQ